MMLFTGSARGKRVKRIRAHGWGRLFAEEKPVPLPDEPWALDNGVFGAWKRKEPWRPSAFMRSLEQAANLHAPTLVVLPDIVGGGAASITRSMQWLAVLPPTMPWYLALQDGMTHEDVAPVLGSVAGLFLGGTDKFKAEGPSWCAFAHEHKKQFHYARVSTENRLRAAIEMGADSADSSQMLWSEDHFVRFERWWHQAQVQGQLFGEVTA